MAYLITMLSLSLLAASNAFFSSEIFFADSSDKVLNFFSADSFSSLDLDSLNIDSRSRDVTWKKEAHYEREYPLIYFDPLWNRLHELRKDILPAVATARW